MSSDLQSRLQPRQLEERRTWRVFTREWTLSCEEQEQEKKQKSVLFRTLLLHGLESDWMEEEMADDDDFK